MCIYKQINTYKKYFESKSEQFKKYAACVATDKQFFH